LSNDVQPYLPVKTGSFDDQFWNPRNDPATWQHMVNLIVVNTSPTVFGSDWQGNMYSGLPAQTAKNWPRAAFAESGLLYDFWRAALNSRGLFIPADDVDEMVKALTATLDEILTRMVSATTLASSIATTESIASTHIYKASFRSSDWSGDLAAYALDANGRPAEAPEWTASIPTSGRKVFFWNGSAGAALSYAALSGAQKEAFNTAAGSLDTGDVMNWILGDRSKEGPAGPLRSRDRLLGDIVNSDPVYVGDEVYPALFRLPGAEGQAYHAFRAEKRNRVKMVYVGANDGMVHGFVAGAGSGGNQCGASLGQELFAYVPGAVVGGLPHLAKPDYTHRFYVDGPLFAGDAYLDLGDGDKWRTLLVGGLGNGGRAVFALDVTDPCAFDAGKVLWEFQHADLGYTHARPLVAKLNNGQWAAIAGNGYNSDQGHAVLFLIDLKTGALIRQIDADAGAGALDNGLMSPTPLDADNNGTVDYVYAGDNLGRLWKFDLSSANPNDWGVAFGGQPLFRTRGEPFQAAPRLGVPPPGQDGVMVYIGSGRLVTEDDKTDAATRALYGILDKGVGDLDVSHLVAQTPNTTMETIAGRTVRKGSQNAVDYATQYGWRLILPAGERIIAGAQMVSGRILFPSLATSSDPCDIGGEGWLYELDPFTGGMPNPSIFILGTDPAQLMALKHKGASKSAIFLRDYGANKGVMLSGDLLGQTDATRFRLTGGRFGRVSWREIID
jgi:type IV pilus assembly protein PilY1